VHLTINVSRAEHLRSVQALSDIQGRKISLVSLGNFSVKYTRPLDMLCLVNNYELLYLIIIMMNKVLKMNTNIKCYYDTTVHDK
jgi:hypothetical protein